MVLTSKRQKAGAEAKMGEGEDKEEEQPNLGGEVSEKNNKKKSSKKRREDKKPSRKTKRVNKRCS